MNRKLLLALAVAAGFAASAAFAQVIPVPTVSIINTNDLVQVVPRGVPSAQSQYATPAQLNNVPGYVKVTPSVSALAGACAAGVPATGCAGYFNTFANSQTFEVIILTGTMAYSYNYAAAAPSDGARECIAGSGGAITQASLLANTGQTVTGGSNISVTSNSAVCWTFSASNLTWDRT